MASITSLGTGSGLDLEGIITKLMAVERTPINNLDTQEASYQAKFSAFGTLKGGVSALETAAHNLASATLFAGKSASSSDSAVIAASANTAATAATYSLEVVDTAKSHGIASQAFASLTSNLSAVDGKIRIELGTFDGGVYTPDPDTTAVTIDISAADSSLNTIRDKINDANAGVRANVVYVGDDGYKLTLTSTSTGASNSIRLTTLDSTGTVVLDDNTELARLSFDPTATAGTGKEFTVSTTATDAHVRIDGLDIYRNSNTISDAITGVTLNVREAGTATLTVSQDTDSASTAIAGFVKAYNDLNTQLRSLTAYDAEKKTGALLFGDSAARALQAALSKIVTYAFPGGSTSPRSLSDIGVAKQRDGSLTFDASQFEAAMESSPSTVSDMFTASGSSGDGVGVYIDAELKSLLATGGILSARTDGLTRSIDDIDDRRDRLNLRLAAIEKRYRAQFTALDTLIASMQQTSQYLTQQLAALTASTSSS